MRLFGLSAVAACAGSDSTAPAISDLDGDGSAEIIMLGSVQNADRSERLRGVGLWVMHSDAARHPDWPEFAGFDGRIHAVAADRTGRQRAKQLPAVAHRARQRAAQRLGALTRARRCDRA